MTTVQENRNIVDVLDELDLAVSRLVDLKLEDLEKVIALKKEFDDMINDLPLSQRVEVIQQISSFNMFYNAIIQQIHVESLRQIMPSYIGTYISAMRSSLANIYKIVA